MDIADDSIPNTVRRPTSCGNSAKGSRIELGVDCEFSGNRDSVLKAHRAWNEHILRKRAGESVKRPIADVMIGAYALSRGGLITRNESDYRTLYPTLRILALPKSPTKKRKGVAAKQRYMDWQSVVERFR